MSPDSTVNLREAARLSGVPLPTLRRWVQTGQVRAYKRPGPFGSQWEIPDSELPGLKAGRSVDQAGRSRLAIKVIDDDDHGGMSADAPHPAANRDASYWRGRWEELREVLERLEKAAGQAPAAALESEEVDSLQEALRQRSRELAQARNLVDNLRREKARLEGEIQALRDRLRGMEVTVVEVEPAPRSPRLAR